MDRAHYTVHNVYFITAEANQVEMVEKLYVKHKSQSYTKVGTVELIEVEIGGK